jgi:hypothetical protein
MGFCPITGSSSIKYLITQRPSSMQTSFMHNTYAILMLLFGLWGGLAVGSTRPVHAQSDTVSPDEETIDRLTQRPDLLVYYGSMDEQAVEGVRQSPLNLSDADIQILIEQARQAYDSTAISQDVRTYMREQYDAEHARAVVDGFDRPAVQHTDSLARYDADFAAIQQYAQTLTADAVGEARIQTVRTLIQTGDAITRFAEATVRLQQAIFQAVQHIDPGAAEEIDPSVLETRSREVATNFVPVTMFYIYQDVPTATLQAYADFYTGEAGQWYQQVRGDAEAYAEEQAAERLVTGVRQAVEARGEE